MQRVLPPSQPPVSNNVINNLEADKSTSSDQENSEYGIYGRTVKYSTGLKIHMTSYEKKSIRELLEQDL